MRILIVIICVLLFPVARAADSSFAAFICGGVTDALEQKECFDKAAMVTRDTHAERSSSSTVPWFSFIWPAGWWVFYYTFGLIFAHYIYRDASKRGWVFLGIRPLWWTLLVVFDPAMGLIAYWATHYSKLAQSFSEASESQAAVSKET